MRAGASRGFVAVIVVAIAVIALAGAGEAVAQGKGKTNSRPITLDYVGASTCVEVTPDPATIWRGQKKKIKSVTWVAVDNLGEQNYYWEIRWKGNAGETDYFSNSSPIDIPCGYNEFRAKVPGKPAQANSAWTYSIEVWACDEADKRGERLCKKDPIVDWGD